ncbi:MAG: four-carbon acid sugar kinase family protein [Bacillota bacterium]|nr:four-carbon acid sugar kinase family protein [Bacillota bacterium]
MPEEELCAIEEAPSSPSLPIYVLADDLTGAADSATYFRTALRRVRIAFDPARPWQPLHPGDLVQVFDSESRGLQPAEAAAVVGQAARLLAGRPARVFKKVDSTLRGNVGAEIEATLHGLGREVALLAPAFPANGRLVVAGRLLVDGRPVTETAAGRDPVHPVRHDRLADVVLATSSLAVVESGAVELEEALGEARRRSPAVLVPETKSEEDLAEAARFLARHPEVLPVGSAGLARPLAPLWLREEPSPPAAPMKAVDRLLVLVGSANPKAHAQLERLVAAGEALRLRLDTPCLAEPAGREEELARASRWLATQTARVVAVELAPERPAGAGGTLPHFEADLAELARFWASTSPGRRLGLVSTGGDTTLALCRALRIDALWPQGEVIPGMPWSEADDRFVLISKAGGFGAEDALLRAVDFLLARGKEG